MPTRLSITIALLSLATEPARGAPADVRRLREELAPLQITEKGGFVRTLRLSPGALDVPAAPEPQLDALLRRHGSALGLRGLGDLVQRERLPDPRGGEVRIYGQLHRGVPVYGGKLAAVFDAAGRLSTVASNVVGGIDFDPRADLDPGEAAGRARAFFARWRPGEWIERVVVRGPFGFRTHQALGREGTDHLAYEATMIVGNGTPWHLFVDAQAGKVLETYPARMDALRRRLYHNAFDPNQTLVNLLWSEGQPYDDIDGAYRPEADAILDTTADTYELFSNLSGGTFLSHDGNDAMMTAVLVDEASGDCPNAYWQGDPESPDDGAAYFCQGTATDDVVAHEWTHGYTEATHDLVYVWQPGALNESFSDVFGESVDQLNGRGLDSPGDPRTAGSCSSYSLPPRPVLIVTLPGTLAGTYEAGYAEFGPDLEAVLPISGDLVLVEDEGQGGDPNDACEPLTNGVALSGQIALIRRGTCYFTEKVLAAQQAGAAAAVVFNNDGDEVLVMAASEGTTPAITIPAVFIGQTLGESLASAQNPAGRLELAPPDVAVEDSYRWLIGEGSEAFGRAIRDMWEPTCLLHPGKVGDDEFFCGSIDEDGGGVHINSGVPNHGFALLVDGGTYNGVSVAGIGLTKALHIYFRAMQVHQGPYTQFSDHADALEAACRDLLGVDLPDPATGLLSGEILTDIDCAQVRNATQAVELRSEPSCRYEPLLDPATPAVHCDGDQAPVELFTDELETDTWEATAVQKGPDFDGSSWTFTTSLPGGRGSGYLASDEAPLPCGSNVDQSGARMLTSPPITLPPDQRAPLLAFDHYVATEAYWDGGIVEISVNEGPWQMVTAPYFLHNGYNLDLADAQAGNTNPLAGRKAFSGTNDGGFEGSWGTSLADLGPYVNGGDTFRLRFQLGVDSCLGFEGWALDRVSLLGCADTDGWFVGQNGDVVSRVEPRARKAEKGCLGGCQTTDGGLGLLVGLVYLFLRRRR